jgi:hypothetical protein
MTGGVMGVGGGCSDGEWIPTPVPMRGLSVVVEEDRMESSELAGLGGAMGVRNFFMHMRMVMKEERRASCCVMLGLKGEEESVAAGVAGVFRGC